MRLIIDPEAREYIEEKCQDKSIRIEGQKVGRGWITYYEPSVRMGPPTDSRKFRVYESDGIKLYLAQVIVPKEDTIRIRLNKFLGKKRILVDGIRATF